MLAHPDTTAETDTGPRRAAGTERLCVVTREVKPTDDMIRFSRSDAFSQSALYPGVSSVPGLIS